MKISPIPAVSGRQVAVIYAFLFAVILLFTPFTLAISASTGGYMPFDNQFPLTLADMRSQLALYTQETRHWYWGFAALDFVFPPLFSLSFAALWAWRLQSHPAGSGASSARLLALPFASALFDWLENLGNITVILAYPEWWPGLAGAALGFKYAKLCAVLINLAVTAWLFLPPRKPPAVQ